MEDGNIVPMSPDQWITALVILSLILWKVCTYNLEDIYLHLCQTNTCTCAQFTNWTFKMLIVSTGVGNIQFYDIMSSLYIYICRVFSSLFLKKATCNSQHCRYWQGWNLQDQVLTHLLFGGNLKYFKNTRTTLNNHNDVRLKFPLRWLCYFFYLTYRIS